MLKKGRMDYADFDDERRKRTKKICYVNTFLGTHIFSCSSLPSSKGYIVKKKNREEVEKVDGSWGESSIPEKIFFVLK